MKAIPSGRSTRDASDRTTAGSAACLKHLTAHAAVNGAASGNGNICAFGTTSTSGSLDRSSPTYSAA
jgi:hypothetical protein